ncbi:unnamed protein product [Heterobilharzia americana]|nr:unnamed protein product [Heterobilharzia americana]
MYCYLRTESIDPKLQNNSFESIIQGVKSEVYPLKEYITHDNNHFFNSDKMQTFENTQNSQGNQIINSKLLVQSSLTTSTIGDVQDSVLGCISNCNSENLQVKQQSKCYNYSSLVNNDKLSSIESISRRDDSKKRYITEITINLQGGETSTSCSDDYIQEETLCVKAVPCKIISKEAFNTIWNNDSYKQSIHETRINDYENIRSLLFNCNYDKKQNNGDNSLQNEWNYTTISQKLFDYTEIDSNYDFLVGIKGHESIAYLNNNEAQLFVSTNQTVIPKYISPICSSEKRDEVNSSRNLGVDSKSKLESSDMNSNKSDNEKVGTRITTQAQLLKFEKTSLKDLKDCCDFNKKSRGTQSELLEEIKVFRDVEIQTAFQLQELKYLCLLSLLNRSSLSLEDGNKVSELPLISGCEHWNTETTISTSTQASIEENTSNDYAVPVVHAPISHVILTEQNIPNPPDLRKFPQYTNNKAVNNKIGNVNSISKSSLNLKNEYSSFLTQHEENKSSRRDLIQQNIPYSELYTKQINNFQPVLQTKYKIPKQFTEISNGFIETQKGMGDNLDKESVNKHEPIIYENISVEFPLYQNFASNIHENDCLTRSEMLHANVVKNPSTDLFPMDKNDGEDFISDEFDKKTPNLSAYKKRSSDHQDNNMTYCNSLHCDKHNSLDTITESKNYCQSDYLSKRNHPRINNGVENNTLNKEYSTESVCEVPCQVNSTISQIKYSKLNCNHSRRSCSYCSVCEIVPSTNSNYQGSVYKCTQERIKNREETEEQVNKDQLVHVKHASRSKQETNPQFSLYTSNHDTICNGKKPLDSNVNQEIQLHNTQQHSLTTSLIDNLFQMTTENEKHDILHNWLLEQVAYSTNRKTIPMQKTIWKDNEDNNESNSLYTCSRSQHIKPPDKGDLVILEETREYKNSLSTSSSLILSSLKMSQSQVNLKDISGVSQSNEQQGKE